MKCLKRNLWSRVCLGGHFDPRVCNGDHFDLTCLQWRPFLSQVFPMATILIPRVCNGGNFDPTCLQWRPFWSDVFSMTAILIPRVCNSGNFYVTRLILFQRGRSPGPAGGGHGGPARTGRGCQGSDCRPQARTRSLAGKSESQLEVS